MGILGRLSPGVQVKTPPLLAGDSLQGHASRLQGARDDPLCDRGEWGSGPPGGGGDQKKRRGGQDHPPFRGAGDAAQAFDPYQGKAALHHGWQSAWEQGAIAGANMAGADLTYPGRITSLSMQIWGWDFQMLGEGNAQGPGYRAMTGDYPKMGIYKKLRDC